MPLGPSGSSSTPSPPALLLAPPVNALVGCVMLRQALEEGGPLWQQIGRYHSPLLARQQHYAQKVFAWLDRLP